MNMMRTVGVFFAVLFLVSSCRTFDVSLLASSVDRGEIDLSDQVFGEDNLLLLSGSWEFYPNRLLSSQEDFEGAGSPIYQEIPHSWNDVMGDAEGYGTYRLNLSLPTQVADLGFFVSGQNCALKVFVNGRQLASMGVVATTAVNYTADKRPVLINLPNHLYGTSAENISLVIQIANFHHRSGGLIQPVYIGSYADIVAYATNRTAQTSLVIGILFFISFSNLFFFLFNRDKRVYLLFAVVTAVFLLRELVQNTYLLSFLFANVGYETYIGLEYITFYLMVSTGFHFLLHLATDIKRHIFMMCLFYVVSAIGVVLVLVLPFRVVTTLVPYSQVLILIGLAYLIVAMILSRVKQKRSGKYLILATLLILLSTIIQGILATQFIIDAPPLDRIGFLAILMMHSSFLLQQFSSSLHQAEKLSTSFKRFVPEQFLNLLGKEDIRAVTLGEYTEREMSIFFADIRDFTKLSESMTPEDNFLFINSYLKQLGPLIRRNSGFIDKYIGDAIMGLFPYKPEDAVQAAVDFHARLITYNEERKKAGKLLLRIGIGIHTGHLMLGTVGEKERIDTTVISDSVNLASRIEGMTKELDAPALITEKTFYAMEEAKRNSFTFRRLHRMKVKGKQEEVFAYEVLDCYPPDRRKKYLDSLSIFNVAMEYYEEKNFAKANTYFKKVLEINPDDRATKYYMTIV